MCTGNKSASGNKELDVCTCDKCTHASDEKKVGITYDANWVDNIKGQLTNGVAIIRAIHRTDNPNEYIVDFSVCGTTAIEKCCLEVVGVYNNMVMVGVNTLDYNKHIPMSSIFFKGKPFYGSKVRPITKEDHSGYVFLYSPASNKFRKTKFVKIDDTRYYIYSTNTITTYKHLRGHFIVK